MIKFDIERNDEVLCLLCIGEKKLSQPRITGGDRSVKFSGESREERNNRRNREDGERTIRNQGEIRRGPSGLVSRMHTLNA